MPRQHAGRFPTSASRRLQVSSPLLSFSLSLVSTRSTAIKHSDNTPEPSVSVPDPFECPSPSPTLARSLGDSKLRGRMRRPARLCPCIEPWAATFLAKTGLFHLLEMLPCTLRLVEGGGVKRSPHRVTRSVSSSRKCHLLKAPTRYRQRLTGLSSACSTPLSPPTHDIVSRLPLLDRTQQHQADSPSSSSRLRVSRPSNSSRLGTNLGAALLPQPLFFSLPASANRSLTRRYPPPQQSDHAQVEAIRRLVPVVRAHQLLPRRHLRPAGSSMSPFSPHLGVGARTSISDHSLT